jgi:alanine racemase
MHGGGERWAMALGIGMPFDSRVGSQEPLVISTSADINGSVTTDTIVQNNCSLHVRGNLIGNLTIDPGAEVVVDGSVDGKIVNRGGRLVVNHKGLAAFVTLNGPSENEAGATLRINLTAIASNWVRLAKSTVAECAAVVRCNAYGCGIAPIVKTLVQFGCHTFFVTDLSEARRVRAAAPHSTIYVLHGFYFGTGPAFAEIDAQPVINSSAELAAWDVFVSSAGWRGGFGLNVDTGQNELGLSVEEAIALASRLKSPDHNVTLLMSYWAPSEKPNNPASERQIARFRDLRRLYTGVTASLVNSTGALLNPQCHFDLVRAGSALFGVNPTPRSANPMFPVVELRARIIQVRNGTAEGGITDDEGWSAKRRRLAFVSIGQADGFPPSWPAKNKLHAIVGSHRCPIAGRPSLDMLPIDVTDLPDIQAARIGEMVTLIGSAISIDEVAEATKSTGGEILSGLGSRFHRVYFAT